MTDSADFTFCQVGVQSSEDDGLGSSETVANMSKISLDESETKRSPFGGSPYSSNGELASVTKNVVEKDGDRASGMEEKKAAAKKSVVRAKVPFEKGHSQMDWLKLTRTHPDLAGLKGRSNRRLISMDEVRQHKSADSTWTVLKGCVYNITPYMKFHPGGVDMLMKGAGKDCTALFNKYHAWVNAEFLLEKCLVGVLDENSS